MTHQDIFLTLYQPKRKYKKWKRFHFTDLLGRHKIVTGGVECDGREVTINDHNILADSYEKSNQDCKK